MATVFWLLIQRELLVLARGWPRMLFSRLMYTMMMVAVIRYFFPLMGLPRDQGLVFYVGSFFMNILFIGHAYAVALSGDIEQSKRLVYYYLLPVRSGVVTAAVVATLVVRCCVLVLPTFFFGLWCVHTPTFHLLSWPILLSMMLVSITFSALLFCLCIALFSSYTVIYRLWPRLFSPSLAFGCNMYPWKVIASKLPYLSLLFLLSPITYGAEGIRAALLGGDMAQYVHPFICMAVLGVLCIICGVPLHRVMLRKLDLPSFRWRGGE